MIPPPGYRLIIAGTRKPADLVYIGFIISTVVEAWGLPGAVLCGGCHGVDAIGAGWAKANGIPVEMFPADWDTHGKAAGPIRNAEMAKSADALLAMPGADSRGTHDMIRKMGKRKPVAVFTVAEAGR